MYSTPNKLTVPGDEMVYAEAGIYMSDNMEMNAKARGGLLKGLKRKFAAGESLFMTEFTTKGDGFAAFAGNAPGRVKPITLKGKEFLAQKDAFLCAESGVDLEITFTKKLGAGFFWRRRFYPGAS